MDRLPFRNCPLPPPSKLTNDQILADSTLGPALQSTPSFQCLSQVCTPYVGSQPEVSLFTLPFWLLILASLSWRCADICRFSVLNYDFLGYTNPLLFLFFVLLSPVVTL